MNPKVEAMTPAQRMSKGLCAECGESLVEIDTLAHRDAHYPNVQRIPLTGEAAVRYAMLTNYAKAQSQSADPAGA